MHPTVRTFRSPARYAQGPGALAQLGALTALSGERPVVVADDVVWGLVGATVDASFAAAGTAVTRQAFAGRATAAAVDALAGRARALDADVLVAVGGGSTADAVKVAAHLAGARCVVVPTVASTDGPCSGLAALVTEAGAFAGYRVLPRTPDLVLVDTQLVADAPVRFLVAGIGDALATWVEARAVAASGASTLAGGPPLVTGTGLARLCWDTLRAEAPAAVAAVAGHRVTDAVERVVEATILLSGLGFESGGLAAAHAVHDGLTAAPQTRGRAHGELVNVGTLTQLVLEGAPDDEVADLAAFTARLGLPTTLTEVGLDPDDGETLALVARTATAPGEPSHAMPFEVGAPDLVAALRGVERVGRDARAAAGLPAPARHVAR